MQRARNYSAAVGMFSPGYMAQHLRFQAEQRAQRLKEFMEPVRAFSERRPIATNMMLCVPLFSTADYIVQRSESKSKPKPMDTHRVACFTLFGGWCSVYWHLLYVSVPRLVVMTAAGFSALNNFVLAPVIFFPSFYMFKAVVQEGHAPREAVPWAVSAIRANFLTDYFVANAIWLPLDTITYMIPPYMRLPMTHVFNFGWIALWSWMRGGQLE